MTTRDEINRVRDLTKKTEELAARIKAGETNLFNEWRDTRGQAADLADQLERDGIEWE